MHHKRSSPIVLGLHVAEAPGPFDHHTRRRPAKNAGDEGPSVMAHDRHVDGVGATVLNSQIELLEQILLRHSIDINASIAHLQADKNPTRDPPGCLYDKTASSAAQRVSQPSEPDGALCSKDSFGVEDDGEVSYFGLSSGRVELLQSNGYTTHSVLPSSARSHLNRFCQEIESTSEVSEELQAHLLSLYFEWEQPWFPLVDETLFRQSMENKGRYFSPLLLNCLLAIGCRYSDRPEVCSVPNDPNTAGRTFLEVAEVLLYFDLQSPSITTIQSLGILAMMHVATGSDSKAWLRYGMAVRLALDMGLNLSGSNLHKPHTLPDVEIKLRRQIYWALYCTDKMWASYTGRVCTMLDSQASVELPLTDTTTQDDVSQREPFLIICHALSTHCQILEKILMSLYAPKRLPPGIQRESFFDACLLELKTWRYRLPSYLQTKSFERSKTKPAPHIYILHMVYQTSLIMLAKPFLSRENRRRPEEDPFTESQNHSCKNATSERAAALCFDAAREICLLGEQYRKAFGSFRQSPVTATHCTLSAVLFFIFSLNRFRKEDHDGDYGSKPISKLISCGILTLGELAHSWMPARHYWTALLAIVNDRQQSQSRAPARCDRVVPSSLDSTPPFLAHEGINDSVWDNALGAGEIAFDFGAEMWDIERIQQTTTLPTV
ncbi:transcriptional regulator family: Fungal Specific TF [Aspergillus niger]|nr:transcriptional regulator family: Fungal Specific TF [Aspergillus niger]KAI2979256.1 transcriptional regulator family: Fungal Specific TF [Aspergillus niger]KAI2985491.1 transcriptional regulator family: Fungal Specific TF [Aspergillus niger]KAI3014171.1 transcriptional regulator family: Fungal Specific TF [Aspergillus niger]KAI3031268.1 transcriptional regulator family: Fungal Specific TF [Aspergillus niger]